MNRYDHQSIEKKWQAAWEKSEAFKVSDNTEDKENLYTLVEFPYPSGNLHVGHWYAFSIPDIFVRQQKMLEKNVLFTIGFDAFGLPAENAALKNNINPRKWTQDNIDYMRQQLRTMGASFDWSREVVTCDPKYYKWTQWLFLQFLKKNLAYQAETQVNWCPSCKTVLANEQVIQGKCERCEHEVEQREMKQWLLKITDYAEKLLTGLDKLDWPEPIKESQRNWIGKSEGAIIKFKILNPKSKINSKSQAQNSKQEIEVFTTRPDTLFGATYMVLAPEHELIKNQESRIKNYAEVKKYVDKTQKKTELERLEEAGEKTGVELQGIKAINPGTQGEIPIYVADYVLASYGTGAIMAVPAHDERDFEFATKFKLPIKEVISGGDINKEAFTNNQEGKLVNSGKFDGQSPNDAIKSITKWLDKENLGKASTNYRLRDWLVSRQRYWGCPIPVIYCSSSKCLENYKLQITNYKQNPKSNSQISNIDDPKYAIIPVPEKNLPVELPDIDDYKPAGDGKSPLAKVEKWVKAKCPECGGEAERETDTFDTFIDSSWYFLRYCDPNNDKGFADKRKMKEWLPIDIYSGGAEHTTLHLLYSRFFIKVMHDLKLVDFDEPYTVRKNRGVILGPDSQKMSKSKGNVIDPDELVEVYGADTVRMYLAFIGPYNTVGAYPWDPKGIMGVRRFLDRVYTLISKQTPASKGVVEASESDSLLRLAHKTIKKVTEDIENFKFNTAISQLMIYVNELTKEQKENPNSKLLITNYQLLITLLAPFAPHITEELCEKLGHKDSVFNQTWPKYDDKLAQEDEIELVVQINGKVRDKLQVPAGISEAEAKEQALASEKVQKFLDGQKPKHMIFAKGKLVNIVI